MFEGAVSTEENANVFESGESGRSPEARQIRAIGPARSLIAAVVGQVAALIDAIRCDSIEPRNRPQDLSMPFLAAAPGADSCLICFSADGEQGRRAEGYVALSISDEEGGVRAFGGSYDSRHRPTAVCEETLSLNGLTHERLGQALMDIHAKVSEVMQGLPGEQGAKGVVVNWPEVLPGSNSGQPLASGPMMRTTEERND